MKAIASLVGLLAVLAGVGLLARQQLSGGVGRNGAVPAATVGATPATSPTPAGQVEQVRQAVEMQMQAPRPTPNEAR